MDKDTTKAIVIKDNSLIQVSKISMNLNEMKAFSFIISNIPDFDKMEIDCVVFNKAQFCIALEINISENNNHIKTTLEKLLQRLVRVYSPNGKYTAFQVLSKIEIDETGENYTVKIHEEMKPLLYNLKERFTEYQLENVLTLKSKYAFRLYEWLKSFHKGIVVGYIGKLKDLFSVEYKKAFDIIRYCIEPAIKEINEKTDLFVSYERQKTGRVVSSIKFSVTEKEELSEEQPLDAEQHDNIKYVITHIKADGTPETFEIKGSAEAQRLIDEKGFEQGRTFISKVGDNVENVTSDFDLK